MARQHQSAGIPAHVAERLNDRFYKSSPHRYFELRLLSLLALDGMPLSEDDADLPESDLGDIALGAPLEFDPSLLSRGERETFVASEAEVLLQHVSEVLVRYFLGHLGWPPCPWLEIAALSNFGAFKKASASLAEADASSLEQLVNRLLFDGAALAEDEQQGQTRVVVQTLQAAAHRLVEDAPLYNAVKHGFTVLAGRSALRFHSTPEPDQTEDDRRAREEIEAFLADEGLTLETLEWSNESGNRSWATKTRYVDPDYAVATAWLTTRVLGNVANTMKARYAASAGGAYVAWYMLDESFTPTALFERSKGKGTHFRVPLGATPLPDDEARRVLDELGYRDREEDP